VVLKVVLNQGGSAVREYSKGFVRKNHGTWTAVVKWQENGKLRSTSTSTGIRCYEDKVDPRTGEVKRDNRGKASAEAFLRKWRDGLLDEAQVVTVEGSDMPLSEYIESFMAFKTHLKPQTVTSYKTSEHRVGRKELGGIPLRDVTPRDIVAFERSLFDEKLSATSVAHTHAFLRQVFKHALLVGDLAKNPMEEVRAPRIRRRPVNALTRNCMLDVMRTLDRLGPTPISVAAKLGLMCGMRRGEVCALRWHDVDFEAKVIHVNHSLSAVDLKLQTPKDPAGGDATRGIPMSAKVEQMLRDRKAAMRDAAEGFCGWREEFYVIGDPISGKFMNPNTLTREWRALANAECWAGTQGQRPLFHDLRHTFATHAIANHMDIMALAAVLGHKNPSTTLDIYAIALEDTKREAIEGLDVIFEA
jgi:integrase